jgi:co-chaperonin GroES (HSP10)
LHPIADALVETHKELETKTKSGLATAAAKAADHVQSLDGAITFGQSNKLRDLAASAARIFGWPKRIPAEGQD